ncbi:uncharacterized protein LOC121376982 [Gigantopelta aegis]|uniref:uncharacterized protein LOC121376982 n=1 Tax=Gigantopelta aegis TaxID=1735272 RepID=UPI001B88BBA6|nr:uncharacterized protein LOC121376982 [Gigantopelta aegis]
MKLITSQTVMLETPKIKRATDIVPTTTSLPDGRVLLIDVMTDSQLSQTFAMIVEASKSGNGFGVDEYTSEKEFRQDIAGSYNFAVMSKDDGEMVAAFLITVSKFYRGTHVADPFVIIKKSERGKGIGEHCFKLCVDFARELGFMGMYVDTFINNKAMIKIIETVGGFQQVGCLPMGGRMKDGSFVSSLIFYRDFRQT